MAFVLNVYALIFAVSIPLLLKCLKQQSEVLHRHNLELAQTNDALAQAYAMQGDSRITLCIKISNVYLVYFNR